MDWIDLTGRAEFLRKLFPLAPSLRGVRVHEVSLQQDGPRVLIRFDLNEFPSQPPPKWIQAGANKVQIRLMCIGVQRWVMRGWTANNIADIRMEAAVGGLRLTSHAKGFSCRGAFEHVLIDAVSGYHEA
jgi:hypothetical protein